MNFHDCLYFLDTTALVCAHRPLLLIPYCKLANSGFPYSLLYSTALISLWKLDHESEEHQAPRQAFIQIGLRSSSQIESICAFDIA